MLKEFIYEGAIIPKPREHTFITQVDKDGFRYRIGKLNSKKVLFKELEIAIDTLKIISQ